MKKIYNLLLKTYGPRGWWPLLTADGRPGFTEKGYHPGIYTTPNRFTEIFEIIMGAVLTQNTNWGNVRKALEQVKEKGLLEPEKLMNCPESELAECIRPSGYYNQKAKKLKILTGFLISQGHTKTGSVPTREELLGLWGIGPETADSILLYAYGVPVFVIDAYTKRIMNRTGFTEEKEYGRLQELFHKKIKPDPVLYNEYHALMVEHAKQHCRVKPLCSGCPLGKLCRWAAQTGAPGAPG